MCSDRRGASHFRVVMARLGAASADGGSAAQIGGSFVAAARKVSSSTPKSTQRQTCQRSNWCVPSTHKHGCFSSTVQAVASDIAARADDSPPHGACRSFRLSPSIGGPAGLGRKRWVVISRMLAEQIGTALLKRIWRLVRAHLPFPVVLIFRPHIGLAVLGHCVQNETGAYGPCAKYVDTGVGCSASLQRRRGIGFLRWRDKRDSVYLDARDGVRSVEGLRGLRWG